MMTLLVEPSEQIWLEEIHNTTGKYPSLEQAKKIKIRSEEKTLTKEILRLLIMGEKRKARTVTLKQNEINKYFTPDYDEQKMRFREFSQKEIQKANRPSIHKRLAAYRSIVAGKTKGKARNKHQEVSR